MIPFEEAKIRLDSVADPNWLAAAEERVRRLSPSLQTGADSVLGLCRPDTHKTSGPGDEAPRAAGTWLDSLDAQQMSAVMEAFHPQMGPTLAAWWVAAQREPYGSGSPRRAFRAPNNPEFTRATRVFWLRSFLSGVGPYAQPLEWFAAWAPYITWANRSSVLNIGPLLAAGIDLGGPSGEAAFQVLIDSGNGVHPIGGKGRHVIDGLLRSSRADGWAFIESLLLAAQRQEGLRQAILEAADEAHPAAFARIIDLVLTENLIRFAATVRAVGVWLGFPENVENIDEATTRLRRLQTLRTDRELASRCAVTGDAWDTYLGLCAIAQFDVEPALELARQAMLRPERDNRAAALQFVVNAQLPDEIGIPIFLSMTADDDLAVAETAYTPLSQLSQLSPQNVTPEIYRHLDAFVQRLPEKPCSVDGVGIYPQAVRLERDPVLMTMIRLLGDQTMAPLVRYVPAMSPSTRRYFAQEAGTRGQLTGDVRAAVLRMIGDRSSDVRGRAVAAMAKLQLEASEAVELEPLLARPATDLRRAVIEMLSRLPLSDALNSAQRLWSGTELQRDAACELLSLIGEGASEDLVEDRSVASIVDEFIASGASARQVELLRPVVSDVESPASDPTLGLFVPSELTKPSIPRRNPRPDRERLYVDPASFRIAQAIDELAEAYRNTVLEVVGFGVSSEVLLADVRWLPDPFEAAADGDEARDMILPDVFRTWWQSRPDDCRGATDALDALRAYVATLMCSNFIPLAYLGEKSVTKFYDLLRPLCGDGRIQLRHPRVVAHVLQWLVIDGDLDSVADECIDATEAAFALMPSSWLDDEPDGSEASRARRPDWRIDFTVLGPWMNLIDVVFRRDSFLMTADRLARWYGLMRWFDQPVPGATRHLVRPGVLYAAHAVGVASDADVYESFVASDPYDGRAYGRLHEFTRWHRESVEQHFPTVVPLADRVRDRVLEIELVRGDLATSATHLVFDTGSIEGAAVTLELLARLGTAKLVRTSGVWATVKSRDAVYGRLIQISHPAATDTPETVAELVKRYGLNDKRLVDLAMFAPQWAWMIESVLHWDGLEDAIWWFHAHTKDEQWSVDYEVRQTWAALSAERTPLTGAELTDGMVDVQWFHRAHTRLGAERWAVLHAAGQLASGGTGHVRAQLFATAMLGKTDDSALTARILKSRHQDSLRALGLLPIPADDAEAVVLARYQQMREYERGSKKFGQQRRAAEALAVRVGIENLARTAGSPDPQRFIWAMEAAEAGDLADGPVTIEVDDVSMTLSVDVEGTPDIEVRRAGKVLKSVPASVKKDPLVVELTNRRTALKRQASRVRSSLEAAMNRQDCFTLADFKTLHRHPVVSPMLDLLIWVDEGGATFQHAGSSWLDCNGDAGMPSGALRIAHPVDLLASGKWIDWQTRLFAYETRQPFKQLFRELYVLTDAEAADGTFSRRWAGHQLQPRHAHALFAARGWVSDPESAKVDKVYHHAGLAARVTFANGMGLAGFGTPAEVELPAIDTVSFTNRNEWFAQPLTSVPAIVFSETMRDLDLVVSVAHAGGVDPEATASTIEMRAALVRETARLMKLDNVTHLGSHVVIEGSLGEYSVHLGSGTVHRRPGGALCIIPVDAQRRGRVFLPFVDDDPKSAEVISKVLLLARDSTIKDPTILEQLRS